MCRDGGVSIISFPSFRFCIDVVGSLLSGELVQGSGELVQGDVGRRSGGCGPPEQ